MTNIYISCCDASGGIMHFTFDGGVLTHKSSTPLDSPMFTIANGRTLHVIIRDIGDKTGGALTYRIDDDGRLCDKSVIITTHGEVPCHHCLKNGNEYVVNYVSGSIAKLPDTVVTHKGRGVHPTRQEKAHTHFVTVAPDGKILCTDLGIDRIVIYDDDLNELSYLKMHDGAGPRHLVFSADGKTLYCANELEPSVSVISYDNGKMEIKNTYPLPQGTAAAIRLHGDDLYVSVRGSDVLARFKTEGDALVLQEVTDVRGEFPRDFDIIENHIICTNEHSDTLSVFALENGKPVYKDTVHTFKSPLCVTAIEL